MATFGVWVITTVITQQFPADSVSSLPEAPLAYARGLDAEEEPLSVIHVLGLNLDRDPLNFSVNPLKMVDWKWINYLDTTILTIPRATEDVSLGCSAFAGICTDLGWRKSSEPRPVHML